MSCLDDVTSASPIYDAAEILADLEIKIWQDKM